MSSISFHQAVKIAAAKEGKTVVQLIAEMNIELQTKSKYNYVWQVFRKKRTNDNIINWFRNRLNIKTAY